MQTRTFQILIAASALEEFLHKKYVGQKDAEAMLFEKVKKGGKGTWGAIPMPPNANVKDDDIKTLVKWVLAGAK